MRGMTPLMLLCVAGSLLASGCASVRITTNLKPEANPTLKSPAGMFYVAGLEFFSMKRADNSQKTWQEKASERTLLPLLRKECIARYPVLFMDDSSTSIPIWVKVRNTTTISHKTAAWMYCSVMLVGLIFPCPGEFDYDIDVTVGLWNGRNGMEKGTIRKSFRNEAHTWVSLLTPLGLIPVPGKSDFPKGHREWVPEQVAQQIATVIAHLVAAKEPSFWNTTGQGLGDSGVLPVTVPPPKDLSAPL